MPEHDSRLPDDARVGLSEEDYQFIKDVAEGRRPMSDLTDRYGDPPRIPVIVLPPDD